MTKLNAETKGCKRTVRAEIKLKRRTTEYSLLDNRIDKDILEELDMGLIGKQLAG
jgi:hypothetical protein